MNNEFEGYGTNGSVYGHDMVVLEHHEQNKIKRRMCRCGCRKKQTHIQYCNGVAMNGGCEKYITSFVNRINTEKRHIKSKQDEIKNNITNELNEIVRIFNND